MHAYTSQQIEALLSHITLPIMHPVRQVFERKRELPMAEAAKREFSSSKATKLFHPGMNLAVAVGSRGVRDLSCIVKETVGNLKRLGVKPAIVPAMGSHGGATVEGQLEILASMGVTEALCGAPIRATMETVLLGTTGTGTPVYMDAAAAAMDGILVINRIKPHTAFSGSYESGLMKMAVVGLGKQPGATAFHSRGLEHMASNLQQMGEVVFATDHVVAGLAILENAYDETSAVTLLSKQEILEQEPRLLEQAKCSMAAIKYPEIDVLIVEKIGKDISGDGMDPNITGRFYSPFVDVTGKPKVQRIVALDISEASHGNGIGLGVADFIPRSLFEKLHLPAIYMNALTNCVLAPAKLPLIMEDEEAAVKAAILTCLGIDRSAVRIVRIKDTLSLEDIWVSEALLDR
jgi:hypothetical protein